MWLKLTIVVCFLTFTEKYVYGQFPFIGKCPEPKVQENFDLGKFFGTWYEIERTMSVMEVGAQCVQTNFSDAGYGDGSVEVIHEGKGPVLKLDKSLRLIAKVPDKKEPAKMLMRLSDLNVRSHYWILHTDYDNYALIWACNQVWLAVQYARTENMWIVSRNRTLPQETLDKIHARLDVLKLKATKLLKKVHQENCD